MALDQSGLNAIHFSHVLSKLWANHEEHIILSLSLLTHTTGSYLPED